PAGAREQGESGEDEDDSPDERDPAPGRHVEDDDLARGQDVVLVPDDRDQALEEVHPADEDHDPAGEGDPAGPGSAARHAYLLVSPRAPVPGARPGGTAGPPNTRT